MHFGLLLKNMERGYMREDHYRSVILTMNVGVIQECEYNLGWGAKLGQPHRTGADKQRILQGSDCSLDPADLQGYRNTTREMESKCLLACLDVICPRSVGDF